MGIFTKQRENKDYNYEKKGYVTTQETHLRDWVVAVFLVTVVAFLISSIVFGLTKAATYAAHTKCDRFGSQTSYETDFVQTSWVSYECIVVLPNGDRITRGELKAIISGDE